MFGRASHLSSVYAVTVGACPVEFVWVIGVSGRFTWMVGKASYIVGLVLESVFYGCVLLDYGWYIPTMAAYCQRARFTGKCSVTVMALIQKHS